MDDTPADPISKTFSKIINTLPSWERELLEGVTLHMDPCKMLDHLDNVAVANEIPWCLLNVSGGSKTNGSMPFGWKAVNGTGPAYDPSPITIAPEIGTRPYRSINPVLSSLPNISTNM